MSVATVSSAARSEDENALAVRTPKGVGYGAMRENLVSILLTIRSEEQALSRDTSEQAIERRTVEKRLTVHHVCTAAWARGPRQRTHRCHFWHEPPLNLVLQLRKVHRFTNERFPCLVRDLLDRLARPNGVNDGLWKYTLNRRIRNGGSPGACHYDEELRVGHQQSLRALASAERQRSTASDLLTGGQWLAFGVALQGFKGDGYLSHRARQLQQLVMRCAPRGSTVAPAAPKTAPTSRRALKRSRLGAGPLRLRDPEVVGDMAFGATARNPWRVGT